MTRAYAEVIGDPIAQSKSPAIHNYWLGKLGIDTSQRTSGDKVKTLMITDPDGNHIAFAEATDPGMAQ